jgi:hypothetical protein
MADFSYWPQAAWPETVPWVVEESDLTSDPECPDWFVELVYGIAATIERLPMTARWYELMVMESKGKVNCLNAALTLIGYSEDC